METGSPPVSDLHAVKSCPFFASTFDSSNQSGWCGPLTIADKNHVCLLPVFILEPGDHFRHHSDLVIAATKREAEKF